MLGANGDIWYTRRYLVYAARPRIQCKSVCSPHPRRVCSLSQASISRTRVSPFCIEAKKHGLHFEGGKADDITVLCVKVLEEEEVEAARDTEADIDGEKSEMDSAATLRSRL